MSYIYNVCVHTVAYECYNYITPHPCTVTIKAVLANVRYTRTSISVDLYQTKVPHALTHAWAAPAPIDRSCFRCYPVVFAVVEETPRGHLVLVLLLAYHHCITTTTMATSASHRGRLYDTEETLNMICDSDGESEDEIDEPMCPGSDEEFPDPDMNDCDDELFHFNNR